MKYDEEVRKILFEQLIHISDLKKSVVLRMEDEERVTNMMISLCNALVENELFY